MASNGPLQDHWNEFGALFRRNYQWTYNLAFFATGDYGAAEEMTQDALLAAWISFERCGRRGSYEAWLLRALSSLAIDCWQRQSSAPMPPLDVPFSTDSIEAQSDTIVPAGTPSPDHRRILDALSDEVHSIIDAMPTSNSADRTMDDTQARSYEEVRQKLRCPVGSVRSRLRRGRLALSRMATEPYTE